MRSVLLLSDINTRASVACLRSLRQHGVPVWCAAVTRRGGFVRYTRYRRSSGLAVLYRSEHREAFCESLAAIAERIGEYVLFPTGERVLRWAVASRPFLASRGICLPTVDLATYERVSDKQPFVALAASHGLPAPAEYDDIPDRFERRLVVKPVRAVFHRPDVLTRPCLVESEESLRLLRERRLDPREHFVQEYVEGPSYYYCALYERGERRLRFVQKTLTQQPDGLSVVRAVPASLPPGVVEQIDGMMRSLSWQGLMMIEVKESGGRHYAIECNPRIWGPLQLAVDNGADFPYLLWRLATGETLGPEPEPSARVGYLWLTGHVAGWVLRRRTATRFQKERAPEGVRFRDVWLRADTLRYFFLELARAMWALVRSYSGERAR